MDNIVKYSPKDHAKVSDKKSLTTNSKTFPCSSKPYCTQSVETLSKSNKTLIKNITVEGNRVNE